MSANHTFTNDRIVFEDVSKFYGEVLGVNHVRLSIPPGITTLVGPNGSGKTTLMNLMTGLVQPTRGTIGVLGIPPNHPERLFRHMGYCTQFDSFPRALTGYEFIYGLLRVHGYGSREADGLTVKALERVGMTEAAGRKVAGYSKGMRQRIKLAQAIAHEPTILVLDEPLNGLDPMARAEVIALFRTLARDGMHVIISSHILHEVDKISDQVVMLSSGYVVAEGQIQAVRGEMHQDHPLQILVRCTNPGVLGAKAFLEDHVADVRMHHDRAGLLVSTRDPGCFYALVNRLVVNGEIAVESVAPADDDVHSVYQYLIGAGGATA
ncbi:MAG TPA: ABC transporter ATP-binding protein [Bryobacteraceae bacterium]|nr:ABC transporter ATP-binding protein [Bryobacteraceae bacterium]